MKNSTEDKIRIEALAERVKLLLAFCADLIPDKDLLKQTVELSLHRHSRALAAAPILGAFGLDWKEAEMETILHEKRARAIFNLVSIIAETEKDRAKFLEKKNKKSEGAQAFKHALGL